VGGRRGRCGDRRGRGRCGDRRGRGRCEDRRGRGWSVKGAGEGGQVRERAWEGAGAVREGTGMVVDVVGGGG
jgi:hypothetical protein